MRSRLGAAQDQGEIRRSLEVITQILKVIQGTPAMIQRRLESAQVEPQGHFTGPGSDLANAERDGQSFKRSTFLSMSNLLRELSPH